MFSYLLFSLGSALTKHKNSKISPHRHSSLRLIAGLILLLGCGMFLPDKQAGAVNIPDAKLEAVIRKELNKPEGELTQNDLSSLTTLNAIAEDITDLTGLEFAVNLTLLQLRLNNLSNLSSLSDLKRLNFLFLGDNQIIDLSPLSDLVNLEFLSLGNNKINDLKHLISLPDLMTLNLQGNLIDISIGSDNRIIIDALKSKGVNVTFEPQKPEVTPVNIPDAALEADIRDELNKQTGTLTQADLLRLTTLTDFSLAATSDLTGLEFAENLKSLNLSGNKISNLTPISGLINLTDLNLSDNNISDVTPLGGLIKLTDLNLSGNDIPILTPLSGLKNLTELFLRSAGIRNINPLSDLKNLTDLRLSSNGISDLAPLSGLKNLTDLRLNSNGISDLAPLSGLTNLTLLNLDFNLISNLDALIPLFRLKHLQLEVNFIDVSEGSPNRLIIDNHIGNGAKVFFKSQRIDSTPVIVPDAGLKAAIRKALNKPTGDLNMSDLLRLTTLDASGFAISNLSGLEFAVNLTNLNLSNNKIKDLRPLIPLTRLKILALEHNLIEISAGSVDKNIIDNFLAKKVDVTFEPQGLDAVPVNIPDTGLVTVLRKALNKPSGKLTKGDLESLTGRLFIGVQNIEDLTGLQFAVNITDLSIGSNKVSNLGPLSGLMSLREFRIIDNNVSDLSPLSTLTDLTKLELPSNIINDLAPLRGLTNLTKLELSDNKISDLNGLEKMIALTNLDLSENNISLLTPLKDLTALTQLQLNQNNISNISPLKSLKSLTNLDLHLNNISDSSPLSDLTELTVLDLSHNEIRVLFTFSKRTPILLSKLDFSYNNIRDLSPLSSIDSRFNFSLKLPGNDIRDISPLRNIKGLVGLDLAGNDIRDISPLSNIKGLVEVDLSYNGIGELLPLRDLSNLKQLDVSNNSLNISAGSVDKNIIDNFLAKKVVVTFEPQDPSFRVINIVDAGLEAAIRESLPRYPNGDLTLGDLENLTTLNASNKNISDLSGLEFAVNLTNLDLINNKIKSLQQLIPLFRLKVIALQHNFIDISMGSADRLIIENHRGNGANVTFEPQDPFSTSENIPDVGLETAIRAALKKPTGELTQADLESLTKLFAGSYNIVDLTGLELAVNLTELDLSANKISNLNILQDLTSLTKLNLFNNEINELSPLTNLNSLTELNLSQNNIINPGSLSGLTNLTNLKLSSNNISDLSPLKDLKNLTTLTLGANEISNLTSISGLIMLINLDLSENNIRDLEPLKSLTKLTGLNLFLNEIIDLNPLSGLTKLTNLDLGINGIFDLSWLSSLTNLTRLDVSRNHIDISANSADTLIIDNLIENGNGAHVIYEPQEPNSRVIDIKDAGLEAAIRDELRKSSGDLDISDLKRLTTLDAGLKNISDISGLEFAVNLIELNLSFNQISDISSLSELKNLKNLILTSNFISDVAPLNPLKNLEILLLNFNLILKIGSLLVDIPPRLTRLALEQNRLDIGPKSNASFRIKRFEGRGVRVTFEPQNPGGTIVTIPDEKLELLIRIRLGMPNGPLTNSDLERLTDLIAIEENIEDLTGLEFAINLTTLDLGNVDEPGPGDNKIRSLFPLKNLTNLTDLNLSGNFINDSDLRPLSRLTKLTKLNLANNRIGGIRLLNNLTNLTHLNLSGNDVRIISTLNNLTNLTHLNLSGNDVSNISPLISLMRLSHLYLDANEIVDVTPLSGLFTLTHLNLQENMIESVRPLRTLPNLIVLDLRKNNIIVIDSLADLAFIKELSLENNFIDISDGSDAGFIIGDYIDLRVSVSFDPQNTDMVIEFSDRNLANSISDALGQPRDDLRVSDLLNLTVLNASNLKITSLSGLRFAKNLTDLDLSGNDIRTLPINELTALTNLNLANNRIKNVSSLNDLTKLTNLNLENNNISDIKPLSDLTDLADLNLANNIIKNVSPLNSLENLTNLNLAKNIVSDIRPLSSLIKLTDLNLSSFSSLISNNIKDVNPLSKMINLTNLDLSGNGISNIFPMTNLIKLIHLNLAANEIRDLNPLTDLALLKELNLQNNLIDIREGSAAKKVIKIQEDRGAKVTFEPQNFDLANVFIQDDELKNAIREALSKPEGKLTQSDLESLTTLTVINKNIRNLIGIEFAVNLTTLNLSGNKIGDISQLSSLTKLVNLDLSNNRIKEISPLSDLAMLAELKLELNFIDIREGFAAIAIIKSLKEKNVNATITFFPQKPPVVNIPDPGLEMAIRHTLNKPDGDLTQTDLALLTTLDASIRKITNLDGIEFAENLVDLDLSANQITDLTPLGSLLKLINLDLSFNHISEIESLAPLANLKLLKLEINFIDISETSAARKFIDGLLSQNKNVTYIPQKPNDTKIADAGLEAAIRTALNKSGGRLTRIDLEGLTTLDARDKNITDLTGLEFALNLTTLDLRDNDIIDLLPLNGLTKLADVKLENNFIDITAGSLARNIIDNLEKKEVTVTYTPQKSPITVEFFDTGLETAIRNALGIPERNLTNADLLLLTTLEASYLNIFTISGLEFATNLTSLDLSFNEISNIAALATLTGLKKLKIENNSIFINEGSEARNIINVLKGKGAMVTFSPQNTSVTIPDGNLRKAIIFALNKKLDEPITQVEMESLTTLDASDGGLAKDDENIKNLEGLEFAVNLTDLDLSSNLITSVGSLSSLTKLVSLDLSNNQISNDNLIQNLSPLSSLTALIFLNLASNDIKDLNALGGLTLLENLNLSSNLISDLSPLSKLTNLAELDLGNNELISDLNPLISLTSLETLMLNGNKIDNLDPLNGLLALTVLHLGNNQIQELGPLSALSNLVILDLHKNSIKNLDPLKDLAALTFLGLSRNAIVDLSPLKNLANLKTLDLHRNRIMDIDSLSGKTSLKQLFLQNNFIEIFEGSDPGKIIDALEKGDTTVIYIPQNSPASSFEVVSHQKISSLFGNFDGDLAPFDAFGSSVTSIGDINGDGIPDLAVGAPFTNPNQNTGAVWILFMDENSKVKSHVRINEKDNGLPEVDGGLGRFGFSIAAIGDLDRDGVPDLAVGVPVLSDSFIDDERQLHTGGVWILFLKSNGFVKKAQLISETHGGLSSGSEPLLSEDDEFGFSIAALGDINGDGVPDMAVGAPNDGIKDDVFDPDYKNGAVWILRLTTSGTTKTPVKISKSYEILNEFGEALKLDKSLEPYHLFGRSVSAVDLNEDGTTDLAVGARIRNGSNDVLLFEMDFIKPEDAFFSQPNPRLPPTFGSSGYVIGPVLSLNSAGSGFPGGSVGRAIVNPGDLDGDGISDLLVSVEDKIWVLFLNSEFDAKLEGKKVKHALPISRLEGGFTGDLDPSDFFGRSLAITNDLNGDSFKELVIGAPGDDDGLISTGAIWSLELKPFASVSGVLFDDLNGDGIRNGGDSGLEGQFIDIRQAGVDGIIGTRDDTTHSSTSVTDVIGRYEFTRLDAGRYYLSVRLMGVVVFRSPFFTLSSGNVLNDHDVGLVNSPEISIGINIDGIENGDSTPDKTDGTDFGDVFTGGSATTKYFLDNSGLQPLLLTGSPIVTLSGDDTADFAVSSQAISPVNIGTGTSFKITFTPATAGLKMATVTIVNNDPDENPFTFNIAGTGVVPASVNGIVWRDRDANGIRDTAELGFANVVVNLFDAGLDGVADAIVGGGDDLPFGSIETMADGAYKFDNLPSGNYYIVVVPLTSATITAQDVGSDDTIDSDIHPDTGRSELFSLTIGEALGGQDAGLVGLPEIGLSGNNISIFNGDNSPSSANGTDLGKAPVGEKMQAPTATFTFTNEGSANLKTGPVTMPTGFLLTENLSTDIAPGQSDDFTVTLDTGVVGTFTGVVKITNDDSDENPFEFTLTGEVEAQALIEGIIWNDRQADGIRVVGELGFSDITVNLFSPGTDAVKGGGDDVKLKTVQSAADGTYGFFGLTPGDYYLKVVAPSNVLITLQDQGADDTVDSDFNAETAETALISLSSPEEMLHNIDAGLSTAAEITITGNGQDITDGDTTPDKSDGTDFGEVDFDSPSTTTFTIQNIGAEPLELTGSTVVTLFGSGALVFTVSKQADTPVAAGGSTSFDVTFKPTEAGIKIVTISIANSDTDEDPFNFNISGIGLPSARVSGLVSIDSNSDGIRDTEEKGLPGITINLFVPGPNGKIGGNDDVLQETTQSAADGSYSFKSLIAGHYYLMLEPNGNTITLQNQGTDDAIDSDVNPVTGQTALFTLTEGQRDVTQDIGLILPPGMLITPQKISSTEGGFTGTLLSGDMFGSSVAALGDLDGDGVTDMVVGAERDNDGSVNSSRGAVWILFMNSDGTVKGDQKISQTAGGFTGKLDSSDNFGTSVATLGDLNGDGIPDLAVGAPNDDDTIFRGLNKGAVWILFLNADGTVKEHQKISDNSGGFSRTLDGDDFFGGSVTTLGDLDGDGVTDLAVGATGDDDGTSNAGAVWVLLLNTDGTVKGHQKITVGNGGFAGSLSGSGLFGKSVTTLGDLDGDGVVDFAVGAEGDDEGGRDKGAVWILFMNTDGTVKGQQKISDTSGNFSGALSSFDGLGSSLATLEDLNGDGIIDLAVGARNAVWILFMNKDGTVKGKQKISVTDEGFNGMLSASVFFGRSLAVLGDLNGDGFINLAVGATGDDDGASNAGAVWLLKINTGKVTGINGVVWIDTIADGIRDAAELPLGDVTVNLFEPGPDGAVGGNDDLLVTTKQTEANGFYNFENLLPGDYFINVAPRENAATMQDQGADDTLDSDVDPTTGDSALLSLTFGQTVSNLDIGLLTVPQITLKGNGIKIADGDMTPDVADNTNFGDVITDISLSHTFAVVNSGAALLSLTATPAVTLSGTGAADFTVNQQPAVALSIGALTPFQITFKPTGSGLITATVSIANDDPDDNPFTYDISGTGLPAIPEIAITGNDIDIVDGDTTPDVADGTDFGDVITAVASVQRFTVENPGTSTLNLTGAPVIDISGADAANFTVSLQPATTVSPGALRHFEITFQPSDIGLLKATVSIASDDADENPFTFDILGTGLLSASINGSVWSDDNSDGIRNDGESGLAGVTVNLFDPGVDNAIGGGDDIQIATLQSSGDGSYTFESLFAGDYFVEVLSGGLTFTLQDQGTDDSLDSNFDPATGQTIFINLTAGQNVGHIDAGLILPVGWSLAQQKISRTAGEFSGVLGSSDRFGASVTKIGDLDGDGVIDLAVGADGDDDGGSSSGSVWILFMRSDFTVKGHQKISSTFGNFTGALGSSDHFGVSVAALGDLDGDGISDLAVGAPDDDDGSRNAGAIWILFLKTDGTVKGHQKISKTTGGFTGVLDSSDFFGQSVGAIGDLDGDGNVDLVVGATGDDDGSSSAGAVWLLLLNADGTVKENHKISARAGGFTGSLNGSDAFGFSVSGAGDLDGDGVVDLAVGAIGDDDGASSAGAVWIIYMNANGTVKDNQKISSTAGGFTGALDSSDSFGISVAALGDIDNDGVVDLLVGATGDDDGASRTGAVWVLLMNRNGTVKGQQKISATTGGFTGDLDRSDSMGQSVAGLGDLNGDGLIDMITGATGDDDGASSAGAVWILSLNSILPASIDGILWVDTDQNGIRETGELGLSGFKVDLYTPGVDGVIGGGDDLLMASVRSTANGTYSFAGLSAGDYYLQMSVPAGLLTLQDQGVDDTLDSDLNPDTGRTSIFSLATGKNISNIDVGFFSKPEITVAGNSLEIVADTTIPDLIDGTDFGNLLVGGGAASALIGDVNVTLNITHSFVEDIKVTLISPTGTRVDLFMEVGSSGNNFVNTTLDDQASDSITNGVAPFTGTFRPIGALSVFNGEKANGRWILEVSDLSGDDDGSLDNWSLAITTPSGERTIVSSNDVPVAIVGEITVTSMLSTVVVNNKRIFDVVNEGTEPLTLGNVTLPNGYMLTEGLGAELAPGESDSFTVQLDTSMPGIFSGVVSIDNGDSDENPYKFNITGTVTDKASVSGMIWGDTDGVGIRKIGASELGKVIVNLIELGPDGIIGNADDVLAGTERSQADGTYVFNNVFPGDYIIEVIPPVGVSFTLQDQGDDDSSDSDVDAVTGRSILFTITGGEAKIRDAGLIVPVIDQQKISDLAGGFTGLLASGDHFGRSVTAVGDLDGDGIAELAVGADTADGGGDTRGAIWILFMNRDGTVKSQQEINDRIGGFTGVVADDDNFGTSLSALGDFDGDGIADIVVGAESDSDGGSSRGAVWILFLNADGTVKGHQKISDLAGGFTGVLADGDHFGRGVSVLGDLNGDGITELAVGADDDNDGGSARGAVWVLFLNADGTVKNHQKISSLVGGFSGALFDFDGFGSNVAALGDLNDDGIPDLAVGADGDSDGGSDRGAVWILFLDTDGSVKSHSKISSTEGNFNGVLVDDVEFSEAITSLGDIDGDGVTDIAVGTPFDPDGGDDHGAVWILFLNKDGTVKTQHKISDLTGGFTGTLHNRDRFGRSLASLGDLNGDGLIELVVGANGDDDGGSSRGAVWVLSLNGDRIAPLLALDDTMTIGTGQPVTLNLLTNDSTGASGSQLTVTETSDPANGSVVINLNNTVTYVPKSGFTGTDRFTYSIGDGTGRKGTATVTVTVEALNRYEEWRLLYFGNLTDAKGEQTADPDGDGLTNFTEFLFAEIPFNGVVLSLPPQTFIDDQKKMHLVFNRVENLNSSVFTIEVSSDLKTWRTAVAGTDYTVMSASNGDGSERMDIVFTVNVDSMTENFVQVHVNTSME